MGRNTGILLSHHPSAEPGHSFTSVSLLPRQHLGWVWSWMHAHCFTHICIYTHLCKHGGTQTCSKLLNLTMIHKHNCCSEKWGMCVSGWNNDKPVCMWKIHIFCTPFYSKFMLPCSLVLKGEQTALSSTCIFFLFQTWRKQRGCYSTRGTRRRST